MIENLHWRGGQSPDQWLELSDFALQGDLPDRRVIWWVEDGLFSAGTLCLTYEGSTDEPLRVRPGGWLHFDGARFGPGRRVGGKDT